MKDIRMNRGDNSGYNHIEFEEIKAENGKAIGVIYMKKPPRNSIGSWLLDAIYDKMDQYEGDDSIGAIIISSKLRGVFSDGADRDELFGSWISGLVAEKNYERFHRAHEMFVEIENCKKPVVAAINGVAIGAGLELALLCDLRIASELSFFSLPEAKPELSIIPGLGGTQRLPRFIGTARAKEMLFLGKMIRAETAMEWGLVNQIVPHKEVLKQTIEIAKTLLERDVKAIKEMKKCINFAGENDIIEGIEYEVSLFSEMMRLKLTNKNKQ
ncbi:MAG TPA: enoyl-CoA hydratase/isomerase family protein [Candidatus Wujingus californicus]|uniref:enoyl-CoA hydratase/isomerase family protein n=1 Tax=Candidatus Wujingus californicus TaxID=3367618 RepID=UPI001DB7F50C|nr:enoyl-CoA hydratase/isomerase family protein [Planctomycetota bacterium]MDO8131518.1 enoyl-CoA hydratase/isomerase family protein [Candidatus Brocadiales bacterium]